MKIESIKKYRDGGSISITLVDVDETLLENLGLPKKPKYVKDDIKYYEVFRNFAYDSKDKMNYFFGDINSDCKQLFLDNQLLLEVKELLEEEKIKRGLHLINKFLFS